ncbi:MAG: MarC family protein [Saprospiraceae bacterium]|nr:MarC family protein [Saprospiraceae bacterium]
MTLAITILASLFSVVNPLGAIPMFLSLTGDYTPEERNKTSLLTSIYFVLILMSFFWLGTYILSFFGVSIAALRGAGGLVILLSGFALLNGKMTQRRMGDKVKQEALEKEDVSFTPMAMPMLSGPGSISLLIGFFSAYPDLENKLIIAGVIIVMGFIIYSILRFSPILFRVLGRSGLKAVARIMGFIVLAIGIEYIVSGTIELVKLHW